MIIILKKDATKSQIENVIHYLEQQGFGAHRSRGEERVVIGALGAKPGFDIRRLRILDGVYDVVRVTESYTLAAKEFKSSPTIVTVNGIKIGSAELAFIAGPCSIESEEQIHTAAHIVAQTGTKILRGGAFEPRSSPYAFQGLGEDGLKYMRKAADRYSLAIVTEVLASDQIALIGQYADIFQVGARNMQNFSLLKELGKAKKPVLLKRGFVNTIEELLLSAEYLLVNGCEQVILCERGIRTFESSTRFSFDVTAILALKEKTHLPVIADPSHAAGIRSRVIPLALAAVAAGADGIMVEVHHDPQKAISDGPQALTASEYKALIEQIRSLAPIVGKK